MVDASAALSALLNAGPSGARLPASSCMSPHLIDVEVANGLRRKVAAQQLDVSAGWAALDALRRLGMMRYQTSAFLDRIWELRDNLSPYDASYVALAELLGCNLLTADGRLGRAPGVRCPVTVVPR